MGCKEAGAVSVSEPAPEVDMIEGVPFKDVERLKYLLYSADREHLDLWNVTAGDICVSGHDADSYIFQGRNDLAENAAG